jgi:HK97 family phage portal protein
MGMTYAEFEARFFPKEERDWLSDSWSLPRRSPLPSVAGPFVDKESTVGLSTAGAAIKMISETIGMMPLKVYRGESPDVTEARDSWQWFRLKEVPNDEQSAYDFWQDAAASIETAGNAYIWKTVTRRPVRDEGDIQLFLIDPSQVMVKRDENNRKYYEVRRGSGRMERVPLSQILHIRGWTAVPGADVGLSPISIHRETIGAALAAREFQSRFYSNGTTLPGFIVTPGTPRQEDVDRLADEWNQRHAGLANSHRPGIMANGATWVPTGLSMRDAQYIESQRFSAEEVCRMCRITPGMLGIVPGNSGQMPDPNNDFERFLQADLGPRIRRIEMALRRDTDLFPTEGGLFPEFVTGSVLRPTLTTRMSAYVDAIQAGVYTKNEARELENRPPKEGGDELQQTPVGGAPNTGGTSDDEGE